jgi:hypothetical protein
MSVSLPRRRALTGERKSGRTNAYCLLTTMVSAPRPGPEMPCCKYVHVLPLYTHVAQVGLAPSHLVLRARQLKHDTGTRLRRRLSGFLLLFCPPPSSLPPSVAPPSRAFSTAPP